MKPAWRSVLLWCLPALLLGLLLRAALWLKMPSAFYHADTEQVFTTWRSILAGGFEIHEKKTPLGPLLYCLPPMLGVPMLPAMAAVQHFLGLVMVAMVGAITAGSFLRWRWFIVPITLAVAVNPALLWYEHTALPETFYVTSIVATALAALYYARGASVARFALLAAALFLAAGFRPEGKLFCFFGVALVLCVTPGGWHWRAGATAAMLLLTALCFWMNATRQGGSLLYSNVAHLTPASLRCAPGFVEANAEHFTALREKWAVTPLGNVAGERNDLFGFAKAYLAERSPGRKPGSRDVNALCGRMGAEVCLRNIFRLPGLAVVKFRYALKNAESDDFGPDMAHRKQSQTFAGKPSEPDRLAAGEEPERTLARIAYGRDFASRGELDAHLRLRYQPWAPDWLTAAQDGYRAAILAWRLPDRAFGARSVTGMPWLYIAAVLGLVVLGMRGLRAYHLLWLGTLLGMAFVLALTGSNLGRFRIGFEPFWFLYAFALVDGVLALAWRKK